MRERDIEAYLVKRVKELGGEVRKVKWIGRNGAPDRVVMLPTDSVFEAEYLGGGEHVSGREVQINTTVWVELKATGKKAEPHQLREHKRMRKMGQRVEVVDSVERVDEVLGS